MQRCEKLVPAKAFVFNGDALFFNVIDRSCVVEKIVNINVDQIVIGSIRAIGSFDGQSKVCDDLFGKGAQHVSRTAFGDGSVVGAFEPGGPLGDTIVIKLIKCSVARKGNGADSLHQNPWQER